MKKLKNKKLIMIMNVACEWGFTNDHYRAVTEIYDKWNDHGF